MSGLSGGGGGASFIGLGSDSPAQPVSRTMEVTRPARSVFNRIAVKALVI